MTLTFSTVTSRSFPSCRSSRGAWSTKCPHPEKRSELQQRLASHIGRDQPAYDSPNKAELQRLGLNTQGSQKDRAARRMLFGDGAFDQEFGEMEFGEL